MRAEFLKAICDLRLRNPGLVFITGDLGYSFFEKCSQSFGEFFINAGIAEQNMITMAAAIAHEGFSPWVYSISPFVTLRPYEQIRNDVCSHNLPVKLVGNGGGYGYGIMGATHHNLQDIGAMRLLPNMKVYVPFLASDVDEAVRLMDSTPSPGYLRLNLGAKVADQVEPFRPWRKLRTGSTATVIGVGPVLENICNLPGSEDLEIWVVSVFPFGPIPDELLKSISQTRRVITMEEHVSEGGLAEALSLQLVNQLDVPIKVLPLFARGYPSGGYGSQSFHQSESGLAGPSLRELLVPFLG